MVEGSGFENRRTARYQGFESLLLRRIYGLFWLFSVWLFGSSQFVVGARRKLSEHTRLGAAVDSFGSSVSLFTPRALTCIFVEAVHRFYAKHTVIMASAPSKVDR